MPAPAIKIGQLRHRVAIQHVTETRDDDGSVVQVWATLCHPRAEIVPLNGSEDFVAQGLSASIIHRITIRFREGITPKMKIVWGDREFEIVTARNLDERGRWLVMNCEEAV
jgi:SPP1 family predicted phage head-tail adaptor